MPDARQNAGDRTAPLCPVSRMRSWPVLASHSRTIPPEPPLAKTVRPARRGSPADTPETAPAAVVACGNAVSYEPCADV